MRDKPKKPALQQYSSTESDDDREEVGVKPKSTRGRGGASTSRGGRGGRGSIIVQPRDRSRSPLRDDPEPTRGGTGRGRGGRGRGGRGGRGRGGGKKAGGKKGKVKVGTTADQERVRRLQEQRMANIKVHVGYLLVSIFKLIIFKV